MRPPFLRLLAVRSALAGLAFAVLLVAACSDEEDELPFATFQSFDALVLEVADAMADHDVERLVSQSSRTPIVCESDLLERATPCKGQAGGTQVEAYAASYAGRGLAVLDGAEFRRLIEGLIRNEELSAAPDQFGSPRLQVFSTLYPDPAPFFAGEEEGAVPERGDIAITYIGRSPSEDAEVKRRLFAALAEKDAQGNWRLRLWLVGFFDPNHPALNPGSDNDFKRWSP